MKTLLLTLLAVLALPSALAADGRPTEESIRRLMRVMQSHNMVDTMLKQMDDTWGPILKQAMRNQELTERQQQIASEAHARIQALYREQLQWQKAQQIQKDMVAQLKAERAGSDAAAQGADRSNRP